MRNVVLFLLLFSYAGLKAQNVYTIKADSVKLTGCDSSELIIENHTQNIPGFLFNTGNGRTVFKRGVVKINDSLYLIGGDTLKSQLPLYLPKGRLAVGGSTGRLTPSSSSLQWDSTNVTLLLSGTNQLNTATELLKFNDTLTSSPGSAAGRKWITFAPLAKGQGTPNFTISQSATSYSGVGQADNVLNMGWNLTAGGGQEVAGQPGVGFSLEQRYIPYAGDTNTEAHMVYLRKNGQQDRLFSWTIKEYMNFYDSYLTAGRTYWRAPSVSGANNYIYANIQPGSFRIDGDPTDTVAGNHGLYITHDTINGATFSLAGNKAGSRNLNFSIGWENAYLPGFGTKSGYHIFSGGGYVVPDAD